MVIIALLTAHKKARTENYSRTNEYIRTKKDVDTCKLSVSLTEIGGYLWQS